MSDASLFRILFLLAAVREVTGDRDLVVWPLDVVGPESALVSEKK